MRRLLKFKYCPNASSVIGPRKLSISRFLSRSRISLSFRNSSAVSVAERMTSLVWSPSALWTILRISSYTERVSSVRGMYRSPSSSALAWSTLVYWPAPAAPTLFFVMPCSSCSAALRFFSISGTCDFTTREPIDLGSMRPTSDSASPVGSFSPCLRPALSTSDDSAEY